MMYAQSAELAVHREDYDRALQHCFRKHAALPDIYLQSSQDFIVQSNHSRHRSNLAGLLVVQNSFNKDGFEIISSL